MSRTSDTPGLTEYLTALAGEDEALARVNRETGKLPHTLLGGRVVEPQDDSARTMAGLNERIAADERVDSALLGLAGGVTLVRRR